MLLRELRRLYRAAALLAHVLLGAAIACAILPLPTRARLARRLAPWWLRRGASVLGVRVMSHGAPVQEACLLVANHISGLDILVIATQSDAGFVAKAEVGRWPLIGWLAGVGGTEFVQRGSHDSAIRVLERMVRRLEQGERLTVFPEGTSRAQVVPGRFRPRLLQAAVEAGVYVQPVAIYYGASAETLQRVAFVGEETFLHHLWLMLAVDPVLAEVTFLPPLSSILGDSRMLADEAWNATSYTLRRLELYELEAKHQERTWHDAGLTHAI